MLSRAASSPAVLRHRQLSFDSFPRAAFSTFIPMQRDDTTHYETLGLQYNAPLAEVKKQFYSLSKVHHPDHNPNDPEASLRFVKISEAYAVLGNSQKRAHYDRSIQRAFGHTSNPRGSNTPPSGPAGGRPSSGLSKRRAQFRGPPPSFSSHGSHGSHGDKRQAHPSAPLGFSEAQSGWDNDVPHFDRDGHFRTQEQQDKRRRRRAADGEVAGGGGSLFFNFIFVSGIVSLAISIPALFATNSTRQVKSVKD